jgi:RimJ/RimL family protein N-acetyltransferase
MKLLPADLAALPSTINIADSLYARATTQVDAPALFAMIRDNSDIPSYTAWAKGVATEDDVIPSLQRLSDEEMHGRFILADEGKVIGAIWAFPGSQPAEFGIGYCLDKAVRGKGYATKAVSAMIGQLKGLGAQQIYLQIISSNLASSAIPQRLGFTLAETVMGVDFPVEQQRWRLNVGLEL